jgi:aminotransferase
MFTPSLLTQSLKQSGIRAASQQCARIGGINLGQGVCDLPTPDLIKQEACLAIEANKSIYSACEGIYPLREAVANKITAFNKINVDASEVVITHGATGAFVCAAQTLFNPGDEVIVFEPFYGYHKSILELMGVQVCGVPIHLDKDFFIDYQELADSITPKTKAIIVCTPNNPSGKVYSRDELLTIGKIAEEKNLYVITDEIYEYITYPGFEHVSLASLENFKERTITISGFSKTYNMTGWRLGYASGPKEIIEKMALVQDLFYACPATPLQYALLAAFKLDASYYDDMRTMYYQKSQEAVSAITEMGFEVMARPQGAYYLLANFSQLGFKDDKEAATFLLEKAKVAAVTGSAFYINPEDGKRCLRFCYALNEQSVAQAYQQMRKAFMLRKATLENPDLPMDFIKDIFSSQSGKADAEPFELKEK